ncbi:MAG: DNA mismatch repair endonuclease MutL [Isosphaeraceae bacterium]
MGIINQLPASVINQIAAGEVVERPASVVKELLENAIDAGATRIDLTVERGGKDLIRIADNGTGIAPDDLPLAFRPHATSKLAQVDDLSRISTLGFRGEALAAIAEISRVRCQSRCVHSSEGTELTVEGGVAGAIVATGCPQGTVLEVRHLFYNTPVRRSFLKSDSTEAGHVQEMFSRIALAHPTVHFTFRSGGKLLHDLPPVTGIRDRVALFFGRELADALLWVESRVESTHLWGYVAHPSQSRSSNKSQYLFVGGRYVRDRSLGHALSEAYRGLLMVGRMPVAFLHLDIPPDEVDVNVHPTKVEVRFRESQRIYSQLLSTVRQTFLSSDLHAKLQASEVFESDDANTPRAPGASAPEASFALNHAEGRRQEVASWFQPPPVPEFKPYPATRYAGGKPTEDWSSRFAASATAGGSSASFDEFSSAPAPASASDVSTQQPSADEPSAPEASSETASTQSRNDRLLATPALKAIQVHDSYLIAETEDGMVVIDQHALHERILFEELRKRVQAGGVESQRLLVPEPVNLGGADALAVLEQREPLRELGIDVEPFGGDTILVTSIPAMLPGIPPERLLQDLAALFRTRPLAATRAGLLAGLLHMIACKAAVKAGQKLTPEEVDALLERRQLAADSHHCPHGRPTALVFTKSELERQFGRI